MKKLTKIISLWIILILMAYSAIIIGTLFHELTHIKNSIKPSAINIEFNGDGSAYADCFVDDDEEYAYLNGSIVTICIILLGQISLLIVLKHENH